MITCRRQTVALATLLALAGLAFPGPPLLPVGGESRATKPKPHSLAGKYWSRETGAVRYANLVDAVRSADFALLGEVHDNGLHHAWRGTLLRDVRGFGEPYTKAAGLPPKVPAVVLEHIRADQRPALDLFAGLVRSGQHLDRPAEFFRFLKWEQSGWPDKKLFEPMISSILAGRHPLFAGDPPRDLVRAVAKSGFAGIAESEVARLGLAVAMDQRHLDALLTELEASHCGLLPKAAMVNMARAQRYRDAHQAAAMIEAARLNGGAVLLAGNGHVRSDRGVPAHLRRLAPDKKIVVVQLVEVEPGKTDPAAYVMRGPDGRPAADFLAFTERAVRTDPCIEMREKFGAKQ